VGDHFIKAFALFIAIFFSACSEDGIVALNSSEPIFLDFNVNQKTLKSAKNEPFALFFLGNDCGSCDEQNKIINEILSERKFSYIAVLNGFSSIEKARNLSAEKNLQIPVIFDAESVEFLSNAVGGIFGVPAIFFFDKDGKMAKKYLGLTPKAELLERMKQI